MFNMSEYVIDVISLLEKPQYFERIFGNKQFLK